MDMFRDAFGHDIDLDKTESLGKLSELGAEELDTLMFKEIGYALCYMDYFHPNTFPLDSPQRKRVNQKIYNFTEERKNNYNNDIWLRKKVFIFQDETENMC